MINLLIKISFYSGIGLLALYVLQLTYGLIKRNKILYLKSIRLLVNFGIVLTLCWGAFMTFAITVRPPSKIAKTEEKSLINLKNWIINQELKIALFLICIVGILGLLSYLYQRKFEKLSKKEPIIKLTLVNSLIVILTLILTYVHTYNGLAIEVGYYFK